MPGSTSPSNFAKTAGRFDLVADCRDVVARGFRRFDGSYRMKRAGLVVCRSIGGLLALTVRLP